MKCLSRNKNSSVTFNLGMWYLGFLLLRILISTLTVSNTIIRIGSEANSKSTASTMYPVSTTPSNSPSSPDSAEVFVITPLLGEGEGGAGKGKTIKEQIKTARDMTKFEDKVPFDKETYDTIKFTIETLSGRMKGLSFSCLTFTKTPLSI